MNKTLYFVALAVCLMTGCNHPKSRLLEPRICYTPTERQFRILPSAFKDLSQEELSQEWGKELKIAIAMARELDLYRAITGFKRAKILIPHQEFDRRNQIDFYIVQSYYLGKKYCEAVLAFESSNLTTISSDFPAFRELLIILHDSYQKNGQCDKAEMIMGILEKGAPDAALNLKLYQVLDEGDLECVCPLSADHPNPEAFSEFMRSYCCCSKSVQKAQMLNAILPGAGYYYVGQKKSALTSFLINASFIAASVHFFQEGNIGMGVIMTSLEFGWYFGGINGAGLAAKEWNEYQYNCKAKDLMTEQKLFPVLMLQGSF